MTASVNAEDANLGMYVHVDYEFVDGAAWIKLADPDRGNVLSAASVDALIAATRRARADGATVIVLSAEGRFFSVGGDIRGFSAAENVETFVDDRADGFHRLISELTGGDAIVVTVVQGAAAGAGFPLAAAGDIVVAAESASFTLGYTRIGFSFDGGTSLLVHTLGLHRALRLALLNDVLTAAEARDAGLVARVVPDGELAAVVRTLVGQLTDGSGDAQGSVKRMLRVVADEAPEAALRRETVNIRRLAAGADGREGIAAFLAKRAPEFRRT